MISDEMDNKMFKGGVIPFMCCLLLFFGLNTLLFKVSGYSNLNELFASFFDLHQEMLSMSVALAGVLKRDIKDHRITMYYQPQFDKYGKMVGVESLLRGSYITKISKRKIILLR